MKSDEPTNSEKIKADTEAQTIAEIICLGLLLLLFWYAASTKFLVSISGSNFDSEDATGLYWTEAAFHYSYAKRVATEGHLPEVDQKMQHPEGVNLETDTTPMMERFAGSVYRSTINKEIPFHVFLARIVSLYSSLTLFAIYFLARYLWGSCWSGLASCLFYTLTFPFIGTMSVGGYVRHDFALPYVFLGTSFLLISIDRRSKIAAIAAAAVFSFAFVSWHMAQFHYAVLIGGLTLAYLWRPLWREPIASSLLVVSIVFLLASIILKPLQAGLFPLSPAMLISYGIIFQHFALPRLTQKLSVTALSLIAIVGLLFVGAMVLSGEHMTRYSHVYRLMLDKLTRAGVLPTDPAELSFESRVMWSSSFLSPSMEQVVWSMGLAWLVGIVGVCLTIRTLLTSTEQLCSKHMVLWMFVSFLGLMLLIMRMDVFVAFYLCLFVGALLPKQLSSGKGILVTVALLLILCLQGWQATQLHISSNQPARDQLKPLFTAIQGATQPDDVILASFQLSPAIRAFTDRAVVVHSKFENKMVRDKIATYYKSLFATEDVFYDFCRKYDVEFVVHEPATVLAQGPESIRYFAGLQQIPMMSPAVQMQFAPATLKHFALVFQTPHHRVFKVLAPDQTLVPPKLPALPIYDRTNFQPGKLGISE